MDPTWAQQLRRSSGYSRDEPDEHAEGGINWAYNAQYMLDKGPELTQNLVKIFKNCQRLALPQHGCLLSVLPLHEEY